MVQWEKKREWAHCISADHEYMKGSHRQLPANLKFGWNGHILREWQLTEGTLEETEYPNQTCNQKLFKNKDTEKGILAVTVSLVNYNW